MMQRIRSTPLKASGRHVRVAADGYTVASVNSYMNDRNAYAMLFAAAPDLFHALKTLEMVVLDVSTPSPEYEAAFPLARAAIAKAEGGDA